MSFSLRGTETILANLDLANANIREQVNQAIQGAGINTQAYAKQACPVDTGRLRSSIQYRPGGDMQCSVACDGTIAYYCWFIELGHVTRGGKSYVAPRPFLFPAFLRAGTELRAELQDIR